MNRSVSDAETPVVTQILRNAAVSPDAPAVIADGAVTGFGALANAIGSIAAYLRGVGIAAGDRVVVQSRPDALCVACFYAVQLCGGVLVPVEKTAGAFRVAEIAAQTHARRIVAFSDAEDLGAPVTAYDTLAALPPAVDFDAQAAAAALRPDDPCEMIFTTGTTGRSKGVLLTHRSMAQYTQIVAQRVELKTGTRFLLTTPLNHAGGLRRTHLMLANGCCMVYMDGMRDIRGYFSVIDRYGVNALYLPPVSIRILLTLAGKQLGALADQIDFVYSSSSPLPAGDCEALCRLLPHSRLYNAYEASETPGVSACDYNASSVPSGCLGPANPGVELAVLPEGGQPTAAPGVRGRICVKSPMNMLCYDGEPELTASVRMGDWFVSGDIGEMDADGNLYYKGREGDVINIGGFKIAPTEVEETALLAGGVRECVCISGKDGLGMSYLKLLVVPEGTLDVPALEAFLASHLEAYKLPRVIEQTDAVRRTFNGKIDRKAYRA